MSPLLLDEKILAIAAAFDRAEIPYAFGGALALAYYAVPRGTQDIDANVFLPVSAAPGVLGVLGVLGASPVRPAERKRLEDEGQARLYWEHTPLDLFFAYDPLHESCRARVRRVPFGDRDALPVLSAEDLAVFKVLFDRRKDWDDLAELLFAQGGDFDVNYVLSWLRRIVEPKDTRLVRFEEMIVVGAYPERT